MTNATFSFSFAFSTREEYLANRAAWKANYKALSIAQREAKQELKTAFRAHDYATANPLIRLIASNKNVAGDLINGLGLAKMEAQRQYLAAHAEKSAVA